VKEEQYRRIERAYGTFHRSFTLPNTVDAAKVGAEYKNGVLTVTLTVQGRSQAAHHQRRRRYGGRRQAGLRNQGSGRSRPEALTSPEA
jgi:hypothetical protein